MDITDQLYQLLRDCIGKASTSDGHGTGFFVAPGLMLTCAHVVEAAYQQQTTVTVTWNGQSYPAHIQEFLAESHPDLKLSYPDLALLAVENLPKHPCVYLDTEVRLKDELYSHGYTDKQPVIGEPSLFINEQAAGEQQLLIKLREGQARPGLSGAPVLNLRTGGVCGVMKRSRDTESDLGAWMIPTKVMLEKFPALVPAQEEFHKRNTTWTDCLRSQQRYKDHTELIDWNIRLPLAKDLNPESLKLGDTTAATFPFIITPVRNTYNIAIQAIKDASVEIKRTKHGILVLGESNAGKTRFAFEAIKKTLPNWPVLRWRPDYMLNDAPPAEFLKGKYLVLFIDDLQDYVPSQIRDKDGQSLIFDPHTTTLRTLIETLYQVTKYVVIAATCRTEDKSRTQAVLNWLFAQLMHINIPSFSADIRDPKAAQIIAEFQKQGPISIKEWDGTLGSLVLGLSAKNSQYLAMLESRATSSTILQAMKLLTMAETMQHTERRLQAVCAGVFMEKKLQKNEKTWREAVNQLTLMQFVTEEIDEDNHEVTLVIRKDIYLVKVVTDYPQSHRPHQILRDFVQLRKVFVKLRDTLALTGLGFAFMRIDHFKEAIGAFDQALALDTKRTDTWIGKGGSLGLLERYKEAIVAFEQALALDPNNVNAWYLKGGALFDLERYEEAIAALEQALVLNPNNVEEWHLKGGALYKLERYEEAIAALEQALALDPNNVEAWHLKGGALNKLERYEEALAAFEQALALDTKRTDIWISKGGSLVLLERYEEAIVAFEQALALDPGNATAWHFKGRALFDLERNEEAIVAFEQALALNPGNATTWHLKGGALNKLERNEEALAAFEQALALDTKRTDTWISKGGSLGLLERNEEALVAFEQALALDPGNATAWHLKGDALNTLERYEEAIAALEQALALDPNNIEAWRLKGHTLYKLERNEEALAAFEQALALDTRHTDAWISKGGSLVLLERYEEAIAAFEQALALDPNNVNAWDLKGRALNKLERYEEAIAALEQALALDPSNVEAWRLKGRALFDLERYEEAIAAFEQALALDPNNVNAWHLKGRALYNLKQYTEAITIVDYALILNPQDAALWFLKGDALTKIRSRKALDTGSTPLQKVEASVLLRNKFYEQAVVAYEHSLFLDPQQAQVWYSKGWVLFELGRYEEAIAMFNHSLTLDLHQTSTHYFKVRALMELERYEEAIITGDQMLAHNLQDADICSLKGQALMELERYEEALIAFDNALALDYQFGYAQQGKAEALRALKYENEARKVEAQAKKRRGK